MYFQNGSIELKLAVMICKYANNNIECSVIRADTRNATIRLEAAACLRLRYSDSACACTFPSLFWQYKV